MKIVYDKLWKKCEERSVAPSVLFGMLGFSTRTFSNMRRNQSVSLRTIDKLCSYFKCQPCDVME